MRQVHTRVLAARGLHVGKALAIKGLRVYSADDQNGNSVLLVRGNAIGPSWPCIATNLDAFDIQYSLIESGKLWLVLSDSLGNREFLTQLNQRLQQHAKQQVLLPEVGFVSTGVTRRFDLRNLVGPIAIVVVSIALAFASGFLEADPNTQEVVLPEIVCALDLSNREIQDWISSSISDREPTASGEVVIQSKLGLLKLKIAQSLGSMQRVTGSIECEDGRSKSVHYRLDASGNGSLVELGQRLDP